MQYGAQTTADSLAESPLAKSTDAIFWYEFNSGPRPCLIYSEAAAAAAAATSTAIATANTTATAAAAATAAATAVYPGVVNLQTVILYGSPSPSLCR